MSTFLCTIFVLPQVTSKNPTTLTKIELQTIGDTTTDTTTGEIASLTPVGTTDTPTTPQYSGERDLVVGITNNTQIKPVEIVYKQVANSSTATPTTTSSNTVPYNYSYNPPVKFPVKKKPKTEKK